MTVAHRVTWFQPDRPVEGNTVYVRPAAVPLIDHLVCPRCGYCPLPKTRPNDAVCTCPPRAHADATQAAHLDALRIQLRQAAEFRAQLDARRAELWRNVGGGQ